MVITGNTRGVGLALGGGEKDPEKKEGDIFGGSILLRDFWEEGGCSKRCRKRP